MTTANDPPKPCDACRVGSHHLCVKVACWRCPPVNHPRHHAAGNSERAVVEASPVPRAKGKARNRVRPPEFKR